MSGDKESKLEQQRSLGMRRAASVAIGPFVGAWLKWVSECAAREKIDKLYFLGRDAQILFKIAGVIAWPCETRYLPISRLLLWRALLHPSIGARSWLWNNGDRTLGSLAFLLDISPELVRSHLGCNWESVLELGAEYQEAEYRRKAEILLEEKNSGVWDAIYRHRANVRRYLAQEGLEGGGRVGLVDTGWAGTIQNILQNMLGGEGVTVVKGYYLGMSNEFRNGKYFVFGPGCDSWMRARTGLVEMFLLADHGSIYSLRRKEDSIVPISSENVCHHPETVELLHREVIEHIRNQQTPDKEAALNALKRLVDAPSREEALAFSELIYAQDMVTGHGMKLVTRYPANVADLGASFCLPWPEASAVLRTNGACTCTAALK